MFICTDEMKFSFQQFFYLITMLNQSSLDDYIETFVNNENEFIQLASSYGNMIKSRKENTFVDTLVAQRTDDVSKNSLSKIFGMEQFPVHTDCAYLKTPPQYILMRYIGTIPNPSPTFIVHFNFNILDSNEIEFINNAIYYVKGSEGGFYSKLFDGSKIRYDAQVMKLLNTNSPNMMELILKKMPQTIIQWQTNKVLLLNNWKALHYRPSLRNDVLPENVIGLLDLSD